MGGVGAGVGKGVGTGVGYGGCEQDCVFAEKMTVFLVDLKVFFLGN